LVPEFSRLLPGKKHAFPSITATAGVMLPDKIHRLEDVLRAVLKFQPPAAAVKTLDPAARLPP